jgi:hypothetical protein
MSIELPDWTQGIVLIGNDGGTLRLVAVDPNGFIGGLLKGEDPSGNAKTLAVDASGQIISILKGASGNEVTVDANGFLATLIKGNDDGTLRTVKVDPAGRLSAFVVDSSDVWDEIVRVGNGELAARLGGLPQYHRTGQVHFQEDFSKGIRQWNVGGSGTGNAQYLSTEGPSTGPYALALVAGSDSTRGAIARFSRALLPVGKVGFSVGWALGSAIEDLEFIIRVYDSTGFDSYGIQYDHANSRLDYLDAAGSWTKIADITTVKFTNYTYNYLKLIVDLSLDEYVTVYHNDSEYDISGNSGNRTAVASTPRYEFDVDLTARSGNNDSVLIDDIVLTTAEP